MVYVTYDETPVEVPRGATALVPVRIRREADPLLELMILAYLFRKPGLSMACVRCGWDLHDMEDVELDDGRYIQDEEGSMLCSWRCKWHWPREEAQREREYELWCERSMRRLAREPESVIWHLDVWILPNLHLFYERALKDHVESEAIWDMRYLFGVSL